MFTFTGSDISLIAGVECQNDFPSLSDCYPALLFSPCRSRVVKHLIVSLHRLLSTTNPGLQLLILLHLRNRNESKVDPAYTYPALESIMTNLKVTRNLSYSNLTYMNTTWVWGVYLVATNQ